MTTRMAKIVVTGETLFGVLEQRVVSAPA